MPEVLPFYIAGKFVTGAKGATSDVIDPADGSTVAILPHAGSDVIDAALDAARQGFRIWRDMPAFDRAALMRAAAANLRRDAEATARTITGEQGKPLAEARSEVMGSADMLDWYAEECRRAYGRIIPSRAKDVVQSAVLEPIGPVAAFTPWNFPVSEPLQKIAGALAAGCSIVVKPSEETPRSCLAIARAFDGAGLPAGVLNVVFGVPDEISRRLIASPVIRMVTFTGSTTVGSRLAALASAAVKPCLLELGGHAPVVVCDDVDLDEVVPRIVKAKFRNAGQVCTSPTRFIVQDAVYERFVELISRAAEHLRVGHGTAAGTEMGPLANARRIEAMSALTADAVDEGARLVVGGRPVDGPGFFWTPTVLVDVPSRARIMREEPFGPVMPVVRFHSLDEAICEANAVDYGLAAYGFTRSAARSLRLSREMDSGNVSLNHFGLAMPETPFGGVKASGYGREGGSEGILSYSRVKFVSQLVS
jgi:succinate-semialdehyde dehydrogenase/glutarate-semialdehyde dehydrogenase